MLIAPGPTNEAAGDALFPNRHCQPCYNGISQATIRKVQCLELWIGLQQTDQGMMMMICDDDDDFSNNGSYRGFLVTVRVAQGIAT